MITIEKIRDFFQNKNLVMFVSSVIFTAGVLSYFYGCSIALALILTIILIVFLNLKIFSIKQTLFFVLIFYFGFFLTFCKIKNYDDLLPLAPMDSEFVGRIVSIPVSPDRNRVKFFMNVDSVASKSIKGRVLVSINSSEPYSEKLNIGEKISIKGNLRTPFSATNPSQFDYSAYLKNFNTFTVLYSDMKDIKILSDVSGVRWRFLRGLNNTRNRILKTHSKYLKSPNLEILGGIVFGDDAVGCIAGNVTVCDMWRNVAE